jgi:amino-acid N-acetyltransferase
VRAAAAAVHPLGLSHAPTIGHRAPSVGVRPGQPADAGAIHALIARYRASGQLLPRTADELASHAGRFVVAASGEDIVGCADLAPLSDSVAEVRSLVVDASFQGRGLGRQLLTELVRRAATAGFMQLCAFTHSPAYFLKLGFSIVPHQWLPEKIAIDCRSCVQFRQCGQYAVVLPLIHG